MRTSTCVWSLVLIVTACAPREHDGREREPGAITTPTAENGAIAFLRVDPADVLDEGVIPTASLVVIEPGRGERVIAANAHGTPSWSPDGSTVAYLGPGGIWTVRPGRPPGRLSRCEPSTCVGDGPPAWSPDGQTLAFGSEREGIEGLWTVRSEGGAPALLAGDLSVRGSPSWAPDGNTIAVIASQSQAGEPAIALLDATTGDVQATFEPSGVAFGASVAWSPSGSELLVTAAVEDQASGREAVYLMGIDGSDMRPLTTCGTSECIDLWPAWSPDGRTVVFTRGRCDELGSDCSFGDLFTMPAGGGPAEQLTEGASLDCCASWQPVPSG
jgi:Tol biopolymer transport system component